MGTGVLCVKKQKRVLSHLLIHYSMAKESNSMLLTLLDIILLMPRMPKKLIKG